jgi:hypothetical protein
MSTIPKTEQEPTNNATTDLSRDFELLANKKYRSADQPQGEPIPDLVAPSRAATFVVAMWIAAIATGAGLVIWAALANMN